MKLRLSLMLITLLATQGCVTEFEQPVVRVGKAPTWSSSIEKFKSCSELDQYLNSYYSYYPGEVVALNSAKSESSEPQVAGIEEGDLFQQDDNYYYFLRPGKIEVISRSELKVIKSIAVENSSAAQWISLAQDQLIYLGTSGTASKLKTYSISEGFKLTRQYDVIGSPKEFRILGENLVFVTWNNLSTLDRSKNDCQDIYKPNSEDGDTNLVQVHRISFKKPDQAVETLSMLGYSRDLFMDESNLFLFTNLWNGSGYFRRIQIDEPTLSFEQAVNFKGNLNDRYSIHQSGMYLLFPVTMQSQGQLVNEFKVFQRGITGQYDYVAGSPIFAEGESIRAVKYKDNKAYVVTFFLSDPFFVFDIENPRNIMELSHVESPGFSLNLQEILPGFVGGLGRNTVMDSSNRPLQQGVQFSLFNVQDETNPIALGTEVWGDRGSYSEAMSNPKALYRDSSRGIMAFPLVELDHLQNQSLWDEGKIHRFSGLQFVAVDDGSLKVLGRLTHKTFREAACGTEYRLPYISDDHSYSADIQRMVRVGDDYITFSRFGVMKHSASTLESKAGTPFAINASLCSALF